MTGTRYSPWGKTRKRLAKRLEELGFVVHELWATQGYPRAPHGVTGEYDECWRWEGIVGWPSTTPIYSVTSYDTMTACARYGITVSREGSSYEVHAKEPK